MNFLGKVTNSDVSPVSTNRSSQILRAHRYSVNCNQENDEIKNNTQKKKTK